MGNNCSATVTVVRGHSRPEQIVPLQGANGNGNTNVAVPPPNNYVELNNYDQNKTFDKR